MIWELATPGDAGGAAGELATLGWSHLTDPAVPIDLGVLEVRAVMVGGGIVPCFNDPFTTYDLVSEVAGVVCRVTVYAANYDGALILHGLPPTSGIAHDVQGWLQSKYGMHRWSVPSWRA